MGGAQKMNEIQLNTWKDTADYKRFERGLIRAPGVHLLSLGMTGAGKTCKAFAIQKWCLDAGKAVAWFDTWKPDDINFLLHYTNKATIFFPEGCDMNITDSKYEITKREIKDPKKLFREIGAGLNIICIRRFFRESPPFMRYMGDIMSGLIDDSFDGKIKTKPIQIFMDEFQTICPAKRLHYTKSQQMLGAKIAQNILQLRSVGVGFCAFTQSYRNILPATRLQFSYYLVCKDPDGDQMDTIGRLLLRFGKLFTKFTPAQGTLIHPNGRFNDIVTWPMPIKDEFDITYSGQVVTEQKGDKMKYYENISKEEAIKLKELGGIKSLLGMVSHTTPPSVSPSPQ